MTVKRESMIWTEVGASFPGVEERGDEAPKAGVRRSKPVPGGRLRAALVL